MTQPANGEWYLATDGKWYCWPDPTPHDEPPAAQAAPPAPPAPPSPEPTPPAPPAGYGAPAFGSPASPGETRGYGAPAAPAAPGYGAPGYGAPGAPGYGSPGGFGVPTGYVQTAGGPAATLSADDNAAKIALGGGALVAVGSFLPWAKVSSPFLTVSQSGMDGGDGYLTLVLGLAIVAVALGAILKRALPSWTVWVPVAAGVAAAILALIDILDVRSKAAEFGEEAEGFASISVGVGLYAVLVGAIVAAVGGWLMRQSSR